MLPYPGKGKNRFKDFLTDDYHISESEILELEHKCKMGFVSVLDDSNGGLRDNLGIEILTLLEL
jgi:5-methylcytosine-specific restriction enzyme subunit McrC